MGRWTTQNKQWLALSPTQRATAMALMESDRMNLGDARSAAGAMINRAARGGEDLGQHVSQRIYQPTIEANQQARLNRIIKSPQFKELHPWVDRRHRGLEPDNVKGATHFLASPKTMLGLERQNPRKYKNWGPRGANWTGYDSKTGQYKNQTYVDGSHAFLAPEGAFSAPYNSPTDAPVTNVSAEGVTSPGAMPLPELGGFSPPATEIAATDAPNISPLALGTQVPDPGVLQDVGPPTALADAGIPSPSSPPTLPPELTKMAAATAPGAVPDVSGGLGGIFGGGMGGGLGGAAGGIGAIAGMMGGGDDDNGKLLADSMKATQQMDAQGAQQKQQALMAMLNDMNKRRRSWT